MSSGLRPPPSHLQPHPLVERAILFIERQPKPLIIALSFALIAVLGVIDYGLASIHVTVIIFFYLLPLFFVSWFTHWRTALIAAVTCGVVNIAVDLAQASVFLTRSEIYFNGLAAFAVYLAAARITSVLRSRGDYEKELARTDYATGAANRRAFFEALELEVQRVRRHGYPLTVVMLDLDDFKSVNDRWGHATGDAVLARVVETLRRDVRTTDVIARLGGDEFALLLPHAGSDIARTAVGRIQKNLLETMHRHGWPVTFSLGVATFNYPPDSTDAVMRQADALMYAAKRTGKNGIEHQVFE